MPACTPPPPPLAAVVAQAAAFVRARVAPIATPTTCLAGDVPAGSGMATPGAIWMSSSDATIFSRPARQWPPDRHIAVLHEVLHQVSMERGLEAEGDMATEEGAVEAVTHDFKPVWLRQMTGRDAAVAIAYPGWVSAVRRASAAATGSAWKSAAARAWRIQLVATPPAGRQAAAGR